MVELTNFEPTRISTHEERPEMSVYYDFADDALTAASEPAWRAGAADFAEAARLEGYTHVEARDGVRWFEDPAAARWLAVFGWQEDFVVMVGDFADVIDLAPRIAALRAAGIAVRSARRD
jgi:hypothetical protein